jgi:hypothetical protein
MSLSWQCYALAGVVFSGLEDIGDRYAINVGIDAVAASFTRIVVYLVFAALAMLVTGRALFWYPHTSVLALALVGAITAVAWSRILIKISISTLSIFAYIAPVLFLVIDRLSGTRVTLLEVLAILGMVLGGIGFAYDEKIRMDRWTFLAVTWIIFNCGAEAYYLKYAQVTYHLDPMGVLLNIWMWAVFVLGFVITYQRGWKAYFQPQVFHYMGRCTLGKSADVASSLCWSIGLTLTAVSQLSAINAFYPLIMLVLVWTIQGVLRVDLGEDLRLQSVSRKTLSAILLFLSLSVI